MTKADLTRMAAAKSGHPISVCNEVARKLFGSLMGTEIGIIADLLFQGHTIEIRGFGTFYSKIRKGREATDFIRKVRVTLPKRIVALFSPSPDMKKMEAP